MRNTILKLDSMASVNQAIQLQDELVKNLNKKNNITIDVSNIQSIDTSIIQLLISFIKNLNENNREVKWDNPSKAFIERCKYLNVLHELNIKE